MDEQIIKVLEKKIEELKNEDKRINQTIDEFPNFDSISFSSGMMIGDCLIHFITSIEEF